MRRLARVFLIPLLAFLASTPLQAATAPGAIPGSFGVSESGAATYSIPIAVPPGTAGMEPKLSLNYSSHGGNGIAGVGWSIGGLSAITRCPQTIVQDGQTRGVQLDANDRFCLDGQRLIVVNGGTYGAVGAEYRTEIESFSKVVSFGGTAGDPQYFKIWTKAGQIIEFGNTNNSRVEAQGKTIATSWAVNKISDTVGNYITFTYFEDNANGEHRITRIDYTGNAAVSPYNAVEFQYEARPDDSMGYLAGSLVRATQRLTNIQTKASSVLVMDYALTYEIGTTTGHSRISNVTQCAADGNCLPATGFVWQEGLAAMFNPVAIESSAPTGTTMDIWFTMGELNGDGLQDILFYGADLKLKTFLADSSGNYLLDSEIQQPGDYYTKPPYLKLFLRDKDGDGIDEPFMCGIGSGTVGFSYSLYYWSVFDWANVNGALSAGPTFGGTFSHEYDFRNGTFSANSEWCFPVDADADGRSDIVPYLSNRQTSSGLPNKLYLYKWDASLPGYRGNNIEVSDSTSSASSVALPTDANGDGRVDFVRYDYASGKLSIWTSNGTAFAATPTAQILDAGGSASDRWFGIADVNGDGLGDMVLHNPAVGDGSLKVWLTHGNGAVGTKVETVFDAGGIPSNTWFILVDVNSDGRADAVKYRPNTGDLKIALSNGDGTFASPVSDNVGSGPVPTLGTGPHPTTSWFSPADVNGDGVPDLVRYDPPSGKIKVNLGQGSIPDRLLSITDGLGATRSISYKPLTDTTVYTKKSGSTYPDQDVQNATYVVSETAADDGVGGQFRNAYRYAGARTHLTGRSFLGFSTLEQTDLQTGIVTRSDYSQSFPTIGQPLLITKTSSGGVELSRLENTYAEKTIVGAGRFPYLAYSKTQGRDLNGAILPVSETWNTSYDDWGNLTQTINQTVGSDTDIHRKQTDNTYTNDAANWFLGRLTRASVTNNLTDAYFEWPAQTRVSAFEYDPSTGLLIKEIIEPDKVQLRLETAYAPDAFGNRKTTTISSPATGTAAIVTRSTTVTYDANGQFPVTVANALGHTETKAFDPRFGTVKSLTGPNVLTTVWQYDSFGRKKIETRADGSETVWTYDVCDAACPPGNGAYRIVTQQFGVGGVQAAPVSVVYFDRLNREIRTAGQAFDGRWIYKDTQYDNQGRVAQVSRPYYAGELVYWSRSEYDDLGRVVKIFEPDAPTTAALTVVYNGLTVIRTNRKNQTTSETANSAGQKINVTDALTQTIQYIYDSFGNLRSTVDPAGNQIVNLYDIRGRKTQTTDPDLGLWKYEYNVLGELVKQTDAKLQISTFKYDRLGRMTQRIEPGLTSDWIWDAAAKGKGKLQRAKTSLGYSRAYIYDSLGRISLVNTNLGDGNALIVFSAYDAAGRIDSTEYPSGLIVKNVYNAQGYLSEVRNQDSNALYWQQNAQDAEGHVIQESYGNGVVTQLEYQPDNGRRLSIFANTAGGVPVQQVQYLYDTLGNVFLRSDDLNQIYDLNTYDKLNRLTKTTATIGGTQTITTVTYDSLGNLTSKTGVGTYTYSDIKHKHAVTQAGSNAYGYDANGNLISGGGRAVAWTAWNMPQSITESGQTTSWLYGPEHDRYKMTTTGRTTWYLNPGIHQGGHYERTQYASGTVEHRHTLYGGGKPIGEVLLFDTAPAQTRYFHSDAQGSITAVTDQNGQVITRYRYDPWGKQTLVFGSNAGIDATRQGHTGHEMLDGGLTHMNGRLYDPVLSRFVSADSIVQAPYDLQSLNRYSYVMNNPLYYTDPTGFSAWTDFRDGFLKPVLSIAASIYLPGSSLFTSMGLTGTSGIIAAGAVSGAISGGGRGALAGAVSAGMFSQLHGMSPGIGKIAAHGVVGGMMSEMQGGSFKSGFLAAGFTQGASQLGGFDRLGNPGTTSGRVANAIGAAIVGGTASVIGGGKFANGAMTGAFSRLFNDLNTEKSCFGKCARVYDPKAKDWMWVPASVAGQSAAAAQTGGTLDSLHTSPAEARKLAQGTLLAAGLVAAPLGAGGLATYSLIGAAALTVTDPNASIDDYASTAVSFATRGLGNYGAGTWVENFANGVESYNTIWQMGDFAKKNQ